MRPRWRPRGARRRRARPGAPPPRRRARPCRLASALPARAGRKSLRPGGQLAGAAACRSDAATTRSASASALARARDAAAARMPGACSRAAATSAAACSRACSAASRASSPSRAHSCSVSDRSARTGPSSAAASARRSTGTPARAATPGVPAGRNRLRKSHGQAVLRSSVAETCRLDTSSVRGSLLDGQDRTAPSSRAHGPGGAGVLQHDESHVRH
jgi:hypothetical protein